MKLTKRDKQELTEWFEKPIESHGRTIQLVGASEKEWVKFCTLADAYLDAKRISIKKGVIK